MSKQKVLVNRLRYAIAFVLAIAQGALAQTPSSLGWWLPGEREGQTKLEAALNSVPTPASLRGFHELLGGEPHIAGTPGDERTIKRLVDAFESMGLAVQRHEFHAYMSRPVDAKVEVINGDERVSLALKEEPLPEDRFSSHEALTIGFNAYSASGDVTAEVVYANQGTKADFAKLKELSVDVAGKIVIARYGGNFRGYKAKFAQETGAAGLIIYTDPGDSGYGQGVPYPEGGWANPTCIQRGSINTLGYPGDPLTPWEAATKDAERLDPAEVALPRIPVQPIGYGAAREIITRMKGRPLPRALVKTWQGGLPCAYRLTGGHDLKVRLMVRQEQTIVKSANVIATLKGSTHPEQKVYVGCHHDAWGYGAADPLAGTILLLESARSFSEAAKDGMQPARSIVFAAWGAEEHGIIGSTEFCEAYRDDLSRNAVAYINLDAAAMGRNFGASAAPTLKRIIAEVTRDVRQVDAEPGTLSGNGALRSVYDAWAGDKKEVHFGNLGGGSDHVGFYCHLGIPSCGLGAEGAEGTAYHSNYDNVHWYQQVVGDDYQSALMLCRIVNLLAGRLANGSVLPLDPVRYATDTDVHLQALIERAKALKMEVEFSDLDRSIDAYQRQAETTLDQLVRSIDSGELGQENLRQINQVLLSLERQWLVQEEANRGTGADWFRSLYARSDPDSGYAAWMLPGLRGAIEDANVDALLKARQAYVEVFDRLNDRMGAIQSILNRLNR
ncbi:MAG: M20/M25/M40 family metallo-hydrolase [Phycisphaerales bacterium]|nr:M20/M25/M40 family metallo-hydrolase [Phycisphaerales bacterium]MCI0630117.1 M20/M25/M40 family metallo-hydrolase [Phycisphaerales bacterium]MCI0676323.1 M20/M25/M40 family metallo-hydrolase [Phycisphaerales bacterium]